MLPDWRVCVASVLKAQSSQPRESKSNPYNKPNPIQCVYLYCFSPSRRIDQMFKLTNPMLSISWLTGKTKSLLLFSYWFSATSATSADPSQHQFCRKDVHQKQEWCNVSPGPAVLFDALQSISHLHLSYFNANPHKPFLHRPGPLGTLTQKPGQTVSGYTHIRHLYGSYQYSE